MRKRNNRQPFLIIADKRLIFCAELALFINDSDMPALYLAEKFFHCLGRFCFIEAIDWALLEKTLQFYPEDMRDVF